ncbi:hypothetical protein HCN83_14235 [Bacillus luteus]|uniref:Uncharacterized protein n=2 Tax=Alkalicoccus luteus TaxID=1237094 RepID=A0A969TUH5_9BACI|nr:hypothetical protein [Alkalicoccus luteus]
MKGRKARLHSDTGFSREAFKTQSGSARALMPFADLNGTGSSDCAASTGVSAGHIGETALLLGEQRTLGSRDCFFRLSCIG